MNTLLQQFTNHSFTEVAGWTLLHFLWQGLFIAIVLGALLAGLRNASASSRYLVACCGMALLALAPIATLLWLYSGIEAHGSTAAEVAGVNASIERTNNLSSVPQFENRSQGKSASFSNTGDAEAAPTVVKANIRWRENLRYFP